MMKKLFLLPLAFAFLLMAGCSNDDVINDDTALPGEATTSYLSVKLVSANPAASRGGDYAYEYGTEDENKVNNVRFYFFTATGAAANVKLTNGSYVNYYDWPDNSFVQSPGTEGNNVGSKLDANLVIETPKGDKLPAQIAVVINPTESAKSRSLSDLKAIMKDYTTRTTNGTFVMSNSVYGNSAKSAEICAVPIREVNLAKNVTDATANPVTIHVERCVAKVSVEMAAEFDVTSGLLALKDKENNEIKVGSDQVYLKINGWKLTAETNSGNLVKDISPFKDWNNSDIRDWWNNYDSYRSCWAVNASDARNEYYTYNQITTLLKTPLYANENAEDYSPQGSLNRTKVILSGTLCKSDGTPFTIVRHLGAHFADTYSTTESENLKALKENILRQLTSDTKYYWKNESDTYQGITVSDLKIVAVEPDEQEDETAHDCFVYAQLTDEAKARTWYTANTTGATPLENGSTIINNRLSGNAATGNVDKALVWNKGMTYYYYEIIHHTDDADKKTSGVVRNHVYKTKVTKIAGLGTPVYNPDQKIYPEKPDPNDHYIAAKINILAWHIVTNNYELEW